MNTAAVMLSPSTPLRTGSAKNPLTASGSPIARVNRPSPYRHNRTCLTQAGDVSECSALLDMTAVFVGELRGAGLQKEGGS